MGYRTKFGTDLISLSLLYVTPASGVVLDRGPRPTSPSLGIPLGWSTQVFHSMSLRATPSLLLHNPDPGCF